VDDRFDEADALRDDGDLPAAIEAYDSIVHELADAEGVEAREAVAQALIAKAGALRELERFDEAQHSFDLVVERFGESGDSDLEAQVARALVRKAWAFRAEGRLEQAVAVSDATVIRYEARDDSDIRYSVGLALATQVECLAELRRPEEALDVARELADYAGGAADSDLALLGIKAHYNEAICLGRLGRNDEALERYRQVIAEPGDGDDEEVVEDVLRAAISAANTLRGLHRADEAESLLAGAIERFDGEPGPTARRFLSLALDAQARAFVLEGRREEAIQASDRIIDMLGSGDDRMLRLTISHALYRKATYCWDVGDLAGYAAAQRSQFDHLWDDPDEDLRHLAATSAEECTGAWCRLGDGPMALEVLQVMIDRFEESDDDFLWARGYGARSLRSVLRPLVRVSGDHSNVLVAYSVAATFVKRTAHAWRKRGVRRASV
jgi:tetratricopeptide (TPR) repeat protein